MINNNNIIKKFRNSEESVEEVLFKVNENITIENMMLVKQLISVIDGEICFLDDEGYNDIEFFSARR